MMPETYKVVVGAFFSLTVAFLEGMGLGPLIETRCWVRRTKGLFTCFYGNGESEAAIPLLGFRLRVEEATSPPPGLDFAVSERGPATLSSRG